MQMQLKFALVVFGILMAPQSPEMDRWLTWHYYSQGSEAFKGDLHTFIQLITILRNELQNIDGQKMSSNNVNWHV